MSLFDTILTAVDFSDMSRDVLRFARRLASASPGAHLVVAHVVLDPLRQPYTVEAVGVDWVRLKEEWMADARQRLEELTTAEGLTPGSFSSVVVMGRPTPTDGKGVRTQPWSAPPSVAWRRPSTPL